MKYIYSIFVKLSISNGGKLPKKVKKVAKNPERWEAGKIRSIFQQVRSNLVCGDPERW